MSCLPYRNQSRALANDIKKMPASRVYSVIEMACANYGDAVMASVEDALRKDFGFGEVRLERLRESVRMKLKEGKANE